MVGCLGASAWKLKHPNHVLTYWHTLKRSRLLVCSGCSSLHWLYSISLIHPSLPIASTCSSSFDPWSISFLGQDVTHSFWTKASRHCCNKYMYIRIFTHTCIYKNDESLGKSLLRNWSVVQKSLSQCWPKHGKLPQHNQPPVGCSCVSWLGLEAIESKEISSFAPVQLHILTALFFPYQSQLK